jgi:cyclopropane-fatty-acyl-phospholipid synthase
MAAFEIFVKHIQPLLPDYIVRIVLWVALKYSLWQLGSKDWPQKELRFVQRSRKMSNIAEQTGAANEQHYEVPTGFFFGHLGPCMKYSSCEFKGPSDTLEAAETRTLEIYLGHLQVDATVRRVLDIGCGWGSFSLYAVHC